MQIINGVLTINLEEEELNDSIVAIIMRRYECTVMEKAGVEWELEKLKKQQQNPLSQQQKPYHFLPN